MDPLYIRFTYYTADIQQEGFSLPSFTYHISYQNAIINARILGCLWPLVFVLNNILTQGILHSAISSQDVLPLDLLSEYRIQHGIIGPLYVTSNYSTRIFYPSEFQALQLNCSCGVWCRGLTTCLLYVGSLFKNQLLYNNWAVGFT